MPEFVQRVASKASGYDPVQAVLTVLALPFYLLGILVALVWLSATWLYAAGVTGFGDARARASKGPEAEVAQ
jgi:hypothetical protein